MMQEGKKKIGKMDRNRVFRPKRLERIKYGT